MRRSRGIGAVRRIAVVTMVALASACAPAAELPAPSVTAEIPVPSTVGTTTTTRPSGPHDVCGRALIWEPGETYVADCFAVPVTFSPADPGWRSIKVGAEWIELSWIDADARDIGIRLLFLALTPEDPPEEVLDRILMIEGVDILRQPSATSVAGLDAWSAGVETQPRATTLHNRTCASMTHAVDLFALERPGYLLLDSVGVGSGAAYGLGACLAFGIWAVDVRGLTITVIAATETVEGQTELRSEIDALLAAVTFGQN